MKARIMVVEDNAANMEAMTYLLEAFDYGVIPARSGTEAVALAASEKPDLILCDFHLPDMDGLEVARRIRADPDLRRIPLLAVTASAMVGDRDRIMRGGFDGYFSKPIFPERFVADMEVYLQRG
jgi:CheY-like chemotaxis protein